MIPELRIHRGPEGIALEDVTLQGSLAVVSSNRPLLGLEGAQLERRDRGGKRA